MFFKREKPRELTFSDHLDQLRNAGFAVDNGPKGPIARRGGFGALLKEGPGAKPEIVDSGLVLNQEIAVLTDVGYQKIFLAPSGHRTAAVAEHLRGLHDFVEDLKEAMGLTSLYNESLGTTNEKHLYDRVENRDRPVAPKPWQRPV